MNDEQSPPTAESLNNEVAEDEEKIYAPQSALPFPETVDLNAVFPEEESDLNDLIPDEETKILLKKIQRNKKDLHTMTDRFNEETWSGADNDIGEPLSEDDSEEPSGDAPATNEPQG